MPEEKNESQSPESAESAAPKSKKSAAKRFAESLIRDLNKARKDLKNADPIARIDAFCKLGDTLTNLYLVTGG